MDIPKTQQAVNLYHKYKATDDEKFLKKSMSIVRNFDRLFNKEELRTIQIANEVWDNISRQRFYVALGENIDTIKNSTIKILDRVLGSKTATV